jgi:hypothetical protein
MSARADRYRQRAADAKNRAGQAKDLSIKSAFEHGAAGWAALAELKRSGSTGRSFHYLRKKPLGTYRAAGFTASLSYTATDAILNLTATLGQPPPRWQGFSSRLQAGRCSHVFGLLGGTQGRWP